MTASASFTPLTKQDIASSLGISIRTVENWINDNILPAPTKLGNRVYWHPDVYYVWLSHRLKEAPSTEPLPDGTDAPQHVRRAPASSGNAVKSLRASTERKLAQLQGAN